MKKSTLFICLLSLLISLPALAQTISDPFTSPNQLIMRLQGRTGSYEFTSARLMVRLDQIQNQLQFTLPLDTLIPASPAYSQVLVQQLFNAGQYPFLRFWFEAPANLINVNTRQPQSVRLSGIMEVQGRQNPMEAVLNFLPGSNEFTVRTSFAFDAYSMGALVPPGLAATLTGLVEIAVPSARWVRGPDMGR